MLVDIIIDVPAIVPVIVIGYRATLPIRLVDVVMEGGAVTIVMITELSGFVMVYEIAQLSMLVVNIGIV